MHPRFAFILSISVIALAMAGTFVLIDGHCSTEVSGASSGACGASVNWALDDNGTLTISGTGEMYSYNNSSYSNPSPWMRSTDLKVVIVEDGVTSIGSYAFLMCSNLESVTIGNSVTSIGDGAFYYCWNLESVTIGNSVTSIGNGAFWDCNKLESIVMPNTVTSIGSNAFFNCSSLTSVVIPEKVTYLGGAAFYKCSSLESVVIQGGVTRIEDDVFHYCSNLKEIDIPDEVTSIGSNAFFNCSSLTSVVIPEKVTSIGNGAFMICSKLASIDIPDSVTSIGDAAFSECSSLESIVIPEAVTRIGNNVFQNCSKLESINIPEEVTYLGGYAFSGCSNLASITIPEEVTRIENGAFSGCSSLASITIKGSVTYIGWDAFQNCSKLESIDIPSSATDISGGAFSGCSKLESINIPEGVTSIVSGTFSNCSSLASFTIPSSVTSIGDAAFSRCSNLASITIPSSVTSIGNGVFWGSGLTSITIPDTVTSIGGDVFRDCSKLLEISIGRGSSPSSAFTSHTFYKTVNGPSLDRGSVDEFKGYTFVGNSINKMVRTDSLTKNHVTYDLGGGTGDAPTQEDVWESINFTAASYSGTRDTYTFGGWSWNNTTYQAGEPITMGTENITLTAVWNPVKHNVIYNVGEGSATAPTQDPVQEGQTFNVASYSGTRDTYTFGGWSWNNTNYQADEPIIMGTSDITLTAVWNPVRHNVTYDVGEGSVTAPTQDPVQEKQEFEVKGYSGTRTGYHFGGWSYNGTAYTEGQRIEMGRTDIVLTAIWNSEEVTFDHSSLIDATGRPDSASDLPTRMDIGDNTNYIQLPDTAGYRHTGWIVDGTEIGTTAELLRTTSHTACSVWEEIPWVTFDHTALTGIVGKDAQGISALSAGMAIEGNAEYVQLPDTAGYRHTGWIVDGKEVGPTAAFVKTSAHTACSVWEEIQTYVPMPDDEDYQPVVIPDQTSGNGGSGSSVTAVATAAGCAAALLVMIALLGTVKPKD